MFRLGDPGVAQETLGKRSVAGIRLEDHRCREMAQQVDVKGYAERGFDLLFDAFREVACAQALSEGVHSADVIINILTRRRDPGPAVSIPIPPALTLQHAPLADCARYDQLRST